MERCNEIRVPSEEAVQLVEYCIQNGYKISTAESCTGGLIAAGIVDVPGASNVFEEGYVTYADRVKQKLLHVSVTTIQKYTVVSAQVAEEMALGTSQASGADISVTTTGYAGPEAASVDSAVVSAAAVVVDAVLLPHAVTLTDNARAKSRAESCLRFFFMIFCPLSVFFCWNIVVFFQL